MRLKNKVAVVTGGASGMGLASVIKFLEEGARVVIADYNADSGNAALKKLQDAGFDGMVAFIRTDVAKESDVEGMLNSAVSEFGALDIVFNNAGVVGAIGSLTKTRVEDWDYTFNILAKGVFLGIKHAARIMQAKGSGGAIINTASISALSGDAGPLAYSAAKAAVISMTKSSAVELSEDRIRVNAVCPGYIVTPLADGGNEEATKKLFSNWQPWPDYGRSEHVASAALFLASDEAEFVTGETLIVDGGITAAGPQMSKMSPQTAPRNLGFSGVTKGSTGEQSDVRRTDS